MEIGITVTACAANPALAKCPRCLRWHSNLENTHYLPDKAEPNHDPSRYIFCMRCEMVLMEDYPHHPAAQAIMKHRQETD